jgi:hypothetical protein
MSFELLVYPEFPAINRDRFVTSTSLSPLDPD